MQMFRVAPARPRMLSTKRVASMKNSDELLGKKVEGELVVGEKGYLEVKDDFGNGWKAYGTTATKENVDPKDVLPKEDKEEMFNAPRYVMKAGQLLIADHEFVSDYTDKKVLRVAPDYDKEIEKVIKPFFDDLVTFPLNLLHSTSSLHKR